MENFLYANQIRGMLTQRKIEMFDKLLMSTGREGMEDVITFLRGTDFYSAPASSKYHSNYQCGLLDHSLVVYVLADKYKDLVLSEKPELKDMVNENKIIIVSLLHDVCKTCMYTPAQKWKKDKSGRWIEYQGYEVNDPFPIGHGEKSVIMLQNIGLKLDPDEMLAIRYHMGFFDDSSLKSAQYSAIQATPLVPILQMADYTASTMIEATIDF